MNQKVRNGGRGKRVDRVRVGSKTPQCMTCDRVLTFGQWKCITFSKQNKISKTFQRKKRFVIPLFTNISKHVIRFENLVYELKAFRRCEQGRKTQQSLWEENLEPSDERKLGPESHKMTKWHNFLARKS